MNKKPLSYKHKIKFLNYISRNTEMVNNND